MPRKSPGRRRTPKAQDWLTYAESVADEMTVAVEILRRLRWAHALAQRDLKIAPSYGPGHGGRYRQRSLSLIFKRILDRLLSPEELVSRLPRRQIKALLDQWESEVREWGHAIWKDRGETLRLRRERADLRDRVESMTGFSASTAAEARRVIADLEADPSRSVHTRSGWEIHHVFEPVDEFGNPLDEELTESDIADLAKQPKDDRARPQVDGRRHQESSRRRAGYGSPPTPRRQTGFD